MSGSGFGAVLRGDNALIRIGARTNIQEGVVIHVDPGQPVTIGQGCTIGHRSIVHGCTIGDNSLIGMGATVLNGAVIGNNCLVGANALVTEGKVFPDNSLIVGAPAKAIRLLDEAAVAGLRLSADSYVPKMAAVCGKAFRHRIGDAGAARNATARRQSFAYSAVQFWQWPRISIVVFSVLKCCLPASTDRRSSMASSCISVTWPQSSQMANAVTPWS